MTLVGWNPLVPVPVVFVAAFIVLAVRTVRRARQRNRGSSEPG